MLRKFFDHQNTRSTCSHKVDRCTIHNYMYVETIAKTYSTCTICRKHQDVYVSEQLYEQVSSLNLYNDNEHLPTCRIVGMFSLAKVFFFQSETKFDIMRMLQLYVLNRWEFNQNGN